MAKIYFVGLFFNRRYKLIFNLDEVRLFVL